jgi:O-antigen/teichoic acid export membrane protein
VVRSAGVAHLPRDFMADQTTNRRPLGGQSAPRTALRRPTFDKLIENSAFGIAITGVNSILGFVFWIFAARFYTTHAVGLASALLAAMTLVSTLSNLGVGSGLVQRLPTRRSDADWSVTLNASVVLAVISGLVAGTATLFVLPLLSKDLSVVRTSPAYAVMFVAGIVLWTLSTTVDFLFVAERSVKYGFVRNASFGLLKLMLVVVAGTVIGHTALAPFGSWVVSSALALLIAVRLAQRRLSHRWIGTLRGMRNEAKSMAGSLVGHHLINLGGYFPIYVLPLIVTARLGVVENAWAYIGWMLGGFALTVSPTVAASLFAEGSHDRASFRKQARRSLGLILALLVPIMIATPLVGRTILGVFGPQYAEHSFGLLIVLVLAAIPDAITNVFVATLRVHARLNLAATVNVGMALLAVGLAWFLVRPLGVAGIGWAWLIAQSVGSVYAIASLLAGQLRGEAGVETAPLAPGYTAMERARLPER